MGPGFVSEESDRDRVRTCRKWTRLLDRKQPEGRKVEDRVSPSFGPGVSPDRSECPPRRHGKPGRKVGGGQGVTYPVRRGTRTDAPRGRRTSGSGGKFPRKDEVGVATDDRTRGGTRPDESGRSSKSTYTGDEWRVERVIFLSEYFRLRGGHNKWAHRTHRKSRCCATSESCVSDLATWSLPVVGPESRRSRRVPFRRPCPNGRTLHLTPVPKDTPPRVTHPTTGSLDPKTTPPQTWAPTPL